MKPNNYNPLQIKQLLCATAILGTASSAYAVDGVWINSTAPIGNNSGLWATTGNWSGGTVATGAGGFADFSQVELTADNVVGIGANTTIGSLKFGDITPSHNWIIALGVGAGTSRTLTLDNNGSAAVLEVLSGTTVTVNGAAQSGAATGLTFNVGANGFNKTGAGTLQIAATKSIFAGSGLVTVAGGILSLNQSAANTTFAGSYQVNETATLAFSNGSLGTGTGVIGMNGGTLKWNAGNTQDISSRLAVQAGTTATFDTGGNNVAFGSAINFSTGGLIKTGAGTLAVGAFTGSGLFRVSEGIVTLSATSGGTNFEGTYQVDSGATLTVGVGGNTGNLYKNADVANQSVVLNGGTLRFNRATGSTNNITAVTGNGTVSVVGGSGGWTQGIGAAAGTTGTIGGTVNFNLESGNATLSLANTYSGGTTVNAGTLTAGHASAFGSGKVTLAGGSLKTGAFTVANDVDVTGNAAISGSYSGNVDTGTNASRTINTTDGVSIGELTGQGIFSGGLVTIVGSHTPGNSPGTQTFESGLAYGNNSSLTLEIAADGLTSDIINVTNGLNIGSNVALTLNLFGAQDYNSAFWDTNRSFTLISTDGKSGDFATPTNNLGGAGEGSWSFDWNGSDYVANWTATAVPEPTTALLGSIGVLFLLRRRRA